MTNKTWSFASGICPLSVVICHLEEAADFAETLAALPCSLWHAADFLRKDALLPFRIHRGHAVVVPLTSFDRCIGILGPRDRVPVHLRVAATRDLAAIDVVTDNTLFLIGIPG